MVGGAEQADPLGRADGAEHHGGLDLAPLQLLQLVDRVGLFETFSISVRNSLTKLR